MKRVLAGAALLSLLTTASGFSQSSGLPIPDSIVVPFRLPGQLNFTGAGARSAGMGGAYLGISDDVSGVSWNPAGLTSFQSTVLGLSWGTLAPRGQFEFNNSVLRQTPSFSDIGLLSIVAPVRIKGHQFVGSISFSRVDDEFSSGFFRDSIPFDSDGDGSNFRPTNVTFAGDETFESGLEVINIGFGTAVGGDISVGGALNVYTGLAETRNFVSVSLPHIQFPLIDPSGLQEIDVDGSQLTLDSTSYSGINFTVGFKYDRPRFSAGFIVRTPYSLELEIDRRSERLLFAKGANSQSVGFSIATDTILSDNNIIQLDMPFMIGGGVAYRPTEDVTLAADGEYRAFSGRKGRVRELLVIVPGAENIERFVEFDPLFNNVFTFRLGGEYKWNTGSVIAPLVPLRAGFSFIPIPEPDLSLSSTGNSIVTSKASAVSFSLGAGVWWEQVHLDAAYVRTSFDRDVLVGTATGQFVPSRLEGRNNQFKFTFTGFF